MQRYTTNPPSRQIAPRPIDGESNKSIHARIIRHLAKTGQRESRFGREAVNDPAFVARLREDGYRPTDEVIRRALSYLRGNANA